MDRHHLWSGGHRIQGPKVQVAAGVPELVPVFGTKRQVPDALLSPERRSQWFDLPRYPQGEVVRAVRRPYDSSVDPVAAGRTQQ